MRPALLALALLLPAAASAGERVYTWVDSQGVRHYSQNPPPDGRAEQRDVSTHTPPPRPAAAPVERTMTEAEASRRCTTARQRLTVLNSTEGEVGYDANNDGIAEPMSPEQKADEIKRAQAEEALSCPQAPTT